MNDDDCATIEAMHSAGWFSGGGDAGRAESQAWGSSANVADDSPWCIYGIPVEGDSDLAATSAGQQTGEAGSWPEGWLDRMFGSLRDVGLERQPQGEYEERDAVD